MEDYDDEPDLEEQIFHNNVREQIVSTYLLNLPTQLQYYKNQTTPLLCDADLQKIISLP